MEPQAPIVLAVDIGGTNIRAALVQGQAQGPILTVPSNRQAAGSSVGSMLEILREAAGSQWEAIQAVGIVSTGPLDSSNGVISNPFTLPQWSGHDWINQLRARLDVPVIIENDAVGAAIGEFEAGAGLGSDVMCMVTLGTGVGVAVVSRAQGPYRGTYGFHPEAGHLPISNHGDVCYCGVTGCWEQLCSGDGIRQYWSDPDGHVDWEGYGSITARAIRILSRTYAPDRFVFGGGIAANFLDFMPSMKVALSERDPMGPPAEMELCQAQLAEPGLRGAAILAMHATSRRENHGT